ncbi:hypothetical protein bthur0004_22420 [Bacillus thuringiensis serovar sotto str. T04001]|nr:hypothetical protein bthur0004_22420 [Bacillus thuringiensis serovar sotto str. T04001]
MSKANLLASLGFAKNAAIAAIKEFSKVINLPNCSLVIGTVCGLLQQSGVKTIWSENNRIIAVVMTKTIIACHLCPPYLFYI